MRSRCRVVLGVLLFTACGGGRDPLIADLQSPRPELRAEAVRKLAKQGVAEDLILFTRAAKDVSSLVRGEAAVALGLSQDSRVVDLLGELLEDPDEDVQGRAALALAKIKSDKAKAYLTLQYGRRGQHTREVIVEALKLANVPGAMASVVVAEARNLWDRRLLVLNEGSPPERVAAAEELGKSGRAEAVQKLLPLLRDSQVVLAAAAARGLGDAGDRLAVGPIALLLSENFPELREAASQALQKLQDPQAVTRLQAVAVERSQASPAATSALLSLTPMASTNAALCQVTLEGSPAEAVASGKAMRSRGGCPMPPLLQRLGQPSQVIPALVAVIGLGPAAKEAKGAVVALLGSSDVTVRALAAEATAALGDESAAAPLLAAYHLERGRLKVQRTDWLSQALPTRYSPGFGPTAGSNKAELLLEKVRTVTAAKARGAGQNPPHRDTVEELVEDVSPEELKAFNAMLRALGKLRVSGALEALREHVKDPSVELRTAALVGLAHLGSTGIPLAKAGMNEADRDLREEVATALVEQGPAGQVAVVELLGQWSEDRLILLEALKHSGAPSQSAHTLMTLAQSEGAEAPAAAEVLGKMKATQAVPTLVALLSQPSVRGQRELVTALGRLGDKSAAPAVAKALYHDSPEVRTAAAQALARMGTEEQVEALDALRGDYYRSVRDAAAQALHQLQAPAAK